jgi:hypothetical protein
MKRSIHWLVADYGIRPAGPPDRCFYCEVPQGQEHAEGCVMRRRTVLVGFTVALVIEVPEHWSEGEIEYYYGDSEKSGPALLDDLEQAVGRMEQAGRSMTPYIRARFVREATEEDEQAQLLRVNDLPS